MPWRSIPNYDQSTAFFLGPFFKSVQEFSRCLFIACPFSPDQALALGEVIGTEPVDAVRQGRTVAHSPDPLADRSPSVADFQVTVKMRFIHINQDDLLNRYLMV